MADFGGSGSAIDSAYLLVNSEGGQKAIDHARPVEQWLTTRFFSELDLLARIPKSSFVNIKWNRCITGAVTH